MLYTFFKVMPEFIFEPVYMFALPGLVLAAVLSWKKRDLRYCIAALAFLFMMGWRLGLQIQTSRYSAILVYPMTIAVAYLFFKLEEIRTYFPGIPEKYGRYLPWLPYLLIAGMCIAELAQLLHFNPYGDYMIRGSAVIKDKAAADSVLFGYSNASRRMTYYSGYEINLCENLDTTIPADPLETERFLRMFRAYGMLRSELWLVMQERGKNKGFPLANDLPKGKYQPDITLIASYHHNRRKKKKTTVYRLKNKMFYKQELRSAADVKRAADNKRKTVYICDFEKPFPETHYFMKMTRDEIKRLEYYNIVPAGKAVPENWCFLQSGIPWHFSTSIYLETQGAINGKSSMRLKSDAPFRTYSYQGMPAGSYEIRYFLKGVPGSKVSMAFHVFHKNQKHDYQLVAQTVTLKNDGLHEFVCTVDKELFDDATLFRPAIQIEKGNVLIDDLIMLKK